MTTSRSSSVIFKVFDKTFAESTHIYLTKEVDEKKWNEVKHNCNKIRQTFAADKLLILDEVHGAEVVDAESIDDFSIPSIADAAVTSKSNIILTVQTADCVPVLLATRENSVIGVAHCGWRSAKENILQNVINLMRRKGAKNIYAIIGPSIQQYNYEVDDQFYDAILASEPDAKVLFIPSIKHNHHLFDLPGFVTMKLQQLGITDIANDKIDTYSNPDKYFSYRRDMHQGIKGNKTNILSAIMFKTPMS